MITRYYSWNPPTDVFESENSLVIRMEIAGMDKSDISIGIENNRLSISGTRKESSSLKAYHQMEISFGEFQSLVNLPDGLDLDQSDAKYEDGFLLITIPFNRATKVKIKE